MTNTISFEAPAGRYGFGQVVRAEWTKIASLRSTIWTLLATVAGTVVVTVLATNSATHFSRASYQGFDPTNQAMTGLALGALAIGVLGSLSATGEYGTGTIRSSLAATPRRRLLLAGKALVVGSIALVVGEVLTFSCFGIGQAILSAGGAPSASLGQAGVLRAVMLSGAFLALLGLLGLGLGVMIRHTAGAIGTYVGVTFLLPVLLRPLSNDPSRYTPVGILANSISTVVHQPGQLSPTVGFLLMVLYSAVALACAAALIVRRDA